MNWSRVTAVFGGTFDPPHLGHQEAVAGLFENPGVSRVLISPSFIAPQKPQAVESQHRVAMAKLCFERTAGVTIDTGEIERGKKTGLPSFSYDTIQELKKDYSDIAFVLGSDQIANLHTWHRFPEILGLCHWIILMRKPGGERQAMEAVQHLEAAGLIRGSNRLWKTASGTSVGVFETPARDLSSRNIREKLALTRLNEEPSPEIQQAVSKEVLSYLMQHCIYGTRSAISSQ